MEDIYDLGMIASLISDVFAVRERKSALGVKPRLMKHPAAVPDLASIAIDVSRLWYHLTLPHVNYLERRVVFGSVTDQQQNIHCSSLL